MRRTPVTASSTSRRRLFAVHPSPARSSRPGSAFSSGTCSIRAVAREARPAPLDPTCERVAGVRARTLEPADEPALSLLRRAVRPVLGCDATLRPLLDAVVADSGGRVERVLDIGARDLLDEAGRQGISDPDPGIAVGLQLDAHSRSLGAGVATLSPAQGAREVLDVVPVLVCEDVRLGEITSGGAELRPELVEEAEVDVDLPVGGAVEGPYGRGCVSTRGRDAAVEEDRP